MAYLRLFAIGGVGFSQQDDPQLEDFILAQISSARPHIGYIGTASQDDPERIRRFYTRFSAASAEVSHLPVSASIADAQTWSVHMNAIYVGGGNTIRLLDTWRQTGLHHVLLSAARRGVLLAGVSAGAVAWFEYALSDASGQGLAPLRGLGAFSGSCCPHYSSEPQRQTEYQAHIARGTLPDGIAIDDGVGVLFDQTGPLQVVSARAGAGAYLVRRARNNAISEPLPATSRL